MTDYPERGKIYLVKIPSTSDVKNRPALVVSLDIRNKLANDVLVVPLSTNLRPSPTHVLLLEGEGGLLRKSMAKCEQVTNLEKSMLFKGPFADKISDEKMKEVERAIMIAIEVI